MLVALGSLGLPVGTQGWREAVEFAQQHPIRIWTDMALFYLIIFGLFPLWCDWRDKRLARRAAA